MSARGEIPRPRDGAHWVGRLAPYRHRAAQPVPGAAIEQRPADEAIGAANELHHLDLLAPILDVEANRVADDDQHADGQHNRAERRAVAVDLAIPFVLGVIAPGHDGDRDQQGRDEREIERTLSTA